MRSLIAFFLVSLAFLTAGCAAPVTDFILPPDSPHQAPHPVSYQASVESVYLQGAETLIQSASWGDQEGHWVVFGNLTITTEDGSTHEATQADIQGSDMSGSAGELHTEARVTLEGPEATLGVGLFGGTMTLQHEVSLIGHVSSDAFTGQATIVAETATIEYSDEAQVTFSNQASVSMGRGVGPMGRSIGVMGGDVFFATFPAEVMQIRGERVDGEVTLHISYSHHFRVAPEGHLDIDVEVIQLYIDDEPKLGCQIHILQYPEIIESSEDGDDPPTLLFRIDGPGSIVRLRSVAAVEDIYILGTSSTRPIGTDPKLFQDLGSLADGGLTLFPGLTYEAFITVRGNQDFQGTSISTLELRSLNCPTKQITVEVKAV